MDDEPRVLPPAINTGAFSQRHLYCLICGESRISEADIRAHWVSMHAREQGEQPIAGEDYARGSHVILMEIRRKQWIAEQAARFQKEMHPGFGPDDFLAEAEIRE